MVWRGRVGGGVGPEVRAERVAEAPMTRRDQQIPPLRVRASHETTRYSSRWLAEAFERLLPQVERRLAQPAAWRSLLSPRPSPRVTRPATPRRSGVNEHAGITRCPLRARLLRPADRAGDHREPSGGAGSTHSPGRAASRTGPPFYR